MRAVALLASGEAPVVSRVSICCTSELTYLLRQGQVKD
jgi:hypothetical protein